MTDKRQSDALRLADELEDSLESHDGSSLTARCQGIADDAAAELRRQHAEIETLTLYKSLADEYGLSIFKDLKDLTTEIETLRAKLKTNEDLGDAADDVQLLRMGYVAARLEIESLRGKGWQPIESAPKGMTMFVVRGFNVEVGNNRYYDTDPYCVWDDGNGFKRWPHPFKPTHWMPLPTSPGDGERNV